VALLRAVHLEDLFAGAAPGVLELAREYVADLDDELRGWLQEADDVVGLQAAGGYG
jgi:hypothetical protein